MLFSFILLRGQKVKKKKKNCRKAKMAFSDYLLSSSGNKQLICKLFIE
jgi:hypothetical protein